MPLLLALLGAALADSPLPTISLVGALERAEQTPGVLASADARTAAWATVAGTWPARLPTFNVSANVLAYDDAQTFSLVDSDTPIDCSTFPESFAAMCAGFAEPTVVREQVTTNLTARATVPISGQIAVDRQVAAAKAGARGADASLDAAVADARYAATEAWYGAVQAEQQVQIAEAQLQSLGARVKAAEASFAAGSLTKSDLLLVRIAESQARQAVLQLSGLREIAYARLGMAVGNPHELVRPDGATAALPAPPPDEETLLALAIAHRPELRAAHERAIAGQASAAVASAARLPSINAVGAYTHTTGQGVFSEPDTAYVGATLDWNVWAWGKAAAGAKASRANADQLGHQEQALEANIRLDVRSRALALSTALASVDLAAATLEQAEEARRIQDLRLANGGGTMTELLDAEAALEKARSGAATAHFDAWRAASALERAVGVDPWAP